MQIFDKLAGVVGQRVRYLHQPVTAVGWPTAALKIVHHLVNGIDLAMAGRNDEFIGHVNADSDQLIRPRVGVKVDAAQRDHGAFAHLADARPGTFAG
ncbi:hypothetical protein D3C71_1870240 [compost metagenome]